MYIWLYSRLMLQYMYFYCYVYVFLLYVYVSSSCQLALFGLPWLRFFRAFSSVVRRRPGYITHKDEARPALFQNFYVVLYIVCFVSFPVLFVCICVLYYCHRVATQLRLTNIYISYHTHCVGGWMGPRAEVIAIKCGYSTTDIICTNLWGHGINL
jgi:hypothetical protein